MNVSICGTLQSLLNTKATFREACVPATIVAEEMAIFRGLINMNDKPLIIFALDSADPKLISRFMNEGDMPNLRELAKRGSQATIKDKDTLIELGIYNVILSGESRSETGYYDFRQLIPGTYKLKHHVDGTDFGRDPFWGLLKKTDIRVFVMDVFDARLIPDLNGVQVANWGVNNMKREMSAFPESVFAEVASWEERIFANQKMPATFIESKSIYKKMMLRLEKKVERILHLLKNDSFGLVVIGFGEVHGATHQFWQYRPDNAAHNPDWQTTELTDAIRNIYRKTDECIGEIIRHFPTQSNTFVISHCGFKNQYPIENLMNNFCVGLGYQTLKQPGFLKQLHPLNIIRRIVPLAWRIELSRRLLNTEQRDGILSDTFENGTDWENTTLFDMSSMFTAFLRVNLKGREPRGVVMAGEEYDKLLEKVVGDLRALRDKKSGEPLIDQIVKTKGTFSDAEPIRLPDIVATFHDLPYFVREAVHPKRSITQEPNLFFRDSTHDDQGLLIAAGENIENREKLPNVSPSDFAPTFLTLLDFPIPEYMCGKPLAKIIRTRN